MKISPEFAEEAHYIGSLSKNNELRHFYQITLDGQVRYIYLADNQD